MARNPERGVERAEGRDQRRAVWSRPRELRSRRLAKTFWAAARSTRIASLARGGRRPKKSLAPALTCQIGGGPIDWMMKSKACRSVMPWVLREGADLPTGALRVDASASCRRRCAWMRRPAAAGTSHRLLSRAPKTKNPRRWAYLDKRG